MIRRPKIYIYGVILSTSILYCGLNTNDNNTTKSLDNISTVLLSGVDSSIETDTARLDLASTILNYRDFYNDALIGNDEGEYSVETANLFLGSIEDAELVKDNTLTTLNDIKVAHAKLDNSFDLFIVSKNDLSDVRASLHNKVQEALDMYNKKPLGYEIGEYLSEDKERFYMVISEGQSLINEDHGDLSADELEIKMIKAKEDIEIAINVFLNSFITQVNQSELISKISELELFVESVTIGERPGNYSEKEYTNLISMIERGKLIIGSGTHFESSNILSELQILKQELDWSKIVYDDINRVDLEIQINEANIHMLNVSIGNEVGQYPQVVYDELNNDKGIAESVLNNADSSQREIDENTNSLILSINKFLGSKIEETPIELAELDAPLIEARELLSMTSAGSELGDILFIHEESLISAVADAEIVRVNENSEQIEIKIALSSLNHHIDEFKKHIIDTEIELIKASLWDLIEESRRIFETSSYGINNGDYPVEGQKMLFDGINKASDVFFDEYASEDVSNLAIIELNNVRDKFILSKIDLNKSKAVLFNKITEAADLHNNAVVGGNIGQYSIESKEKLAYAIEYAQIYYNNENVLINDIDMHIALIESEINVFTESVLTKVDDSLLVLTINEMEEFLAEVVVGDSPNQYRQSSKDEFIVVLEEAELKVNTAHSYEELLLSVDTLNKAKSTFMSSVIVYSDINRAQLEEELFDADVLKNSIIIGVNPGEYLERDFNEFNLAIFDTREILDNSGSGQREIDNATLSIRSAMVEFKNSAIKREDINVDNLINLINEASVLISNTEVGYDINQVTENERQILELAIEDANSTINKISSTQNDIDLTYSKLEESLRVFKSKIKLVADKLQLAKALKDANSIKESIISSMIGSAIGQYPRASFDKFSDAIALAQKIHDEVKSTQLIVDNTAKELVNEVSVFMKSKVADQSIDKTELLGLYNEAQNILSSAVGGTEDGQYPIGKLNSFKIEVELTKGIIDDVYAEQDTVDSQKEKLTLAITIFEESKTKSTVKLKDELMNMIRTAKELYNLSKEGVALGEYPTYARSEFKKVIEEVESISNNASSTSKDYEQAKILLETGMSDYKESINKNAPPEDYQAELNLELEKLILMIKNSPINEDEGITENSKIALNLMHMKINDMVKDSPSKATLKEAIKLTKYTLSDFKDRSIYVDNNSKVNGRKLTGKINKKSPRPNQIEIDGETPFIPQVGLPIDLKQSISALGFILINTGLIISKKKK